MIPRNHLLAAARGRCSVFEMLQRSLSTSPGNGTTRASSSKPPIKVAFVADGPNDYGYLPEEGDPRFTNNQPTLEYAKCMPICFSSMRHEQILQLSADGVPEARAEALVRNIMAVDEIEYEEARIVMEEIREANGENFAVHHLPHGVGLVGAIVAGIASVPLVFYLPSVERFNDAYVTAEMPDKVDLETWLEVGSCSWSWMEPVLGEASFLLLAAQFARSQMKNLGIRPYTNFMRERRADKLISLYPKYDSTILGQFSRVH
uniref:Uncharacterized protein n=1 Tax=Ditylum brightwellii TaxID=49249 RepID=A0A6U3SST2_9STRA